MPRAVSPKETSRAVQGTASAARVADVLLAVGADNGTIGVSEVSRRTGLSKAVVHRILRSLESRQLVRFVSGERAYELGAAAVTLGQQARSKHALRTAALPVLRALQEATGETTTVSALVGTGRVYLDQIVSPRELTMMVQVGRVFPLHAGSSGKAILAFAPAALRAHVLSGPLPALTPQTITERKELEAELDRIARRGVATSRGERQYGTGSVAAPVFAPDGTVVGSVSACGPVARFDDETVQRLLPLLREVARDVSAALAHG